MAAPQGRRSARRPGRANSDAERRALAKASGRRTGRPPPAPRSGFAVLATDGGSRGNPGPAAIGYVLAAPDGTPLAAHGEAIGIAGANVAEYRALLAGLERACELGLDRVDARCDARLVVEQVSGGREPANPRLRELCTAVRDAAQRIGTVVFTWVPAGANGSAHALVAEALAIDRDGRRRDGDRVAPAGPDATMTTMNAAGPTTDGVSLWPRLAELPLVVEACEFDRLHAVLAFEFERITTHVRLVGAGTDGLGEDVSVFREDGTTLHETRPSLPLAGEWTLAGFCAHVATLELWPQPPEWPGAVRFRTWAFESAALDLALRQAGRALHEVLGREPQPVRFVNSLGLGKAPSIEPVRRRIARSPGVRFKLDAEATWTPGLVDEVAATGAVDTIDFKGHYGFEVEDPEALAALYDHVLAAFPDAYLEDPHDLSEIARRLGDHLERVSYDSPIRTADDIGATPLAGRVVNVKPSRIGGLRDLFEVYARCARERRPMYGGGMGELGVGRGQIELLAALFHADAPNDVAPSAYNEDDPPGGLPASPLAPRPAATGFRWAT